MLIYTFTSIGIYYLYNYIDNNNIFNKNNNNKSILTKEYRIVNKTKAYILVMLSPLSILYIYSILIGQPITNFYLSNFIGSIYASTDMSAMFYNNKTHISTWMHHITVQLLYVYCYLNKFDMHTSLSQPICVYCCFSSLAYLVNYRLSIRDSAKSKDTKGKNIELIINNISFIIYFVTCIVNWVLQINYLLDTENIYRNYEKYIYFLILVMIIHDDIYLMKYLVNYNNKIVNK